MTTAARTRLLHEICDLVTDRQTAELIRSMDPDDHITFAEAYCAVRTLPGLTRDLRRRLLAEIETLADHEARQAHAARTGRPALLTVRSGADIG